jgi:uncharacterized repeat protein (TIGR03803 family)
METLLPHDSIPRQELVIQAKEDTMLHVRCFLKRFGARSMPPLTSHLAVALIAALIATSSLTAEAQKLTTLYSFAGQEDGSHPEAGLVLDANGNLYGTNPLLVFELTADGTFQVLHRFLGVKKDGLGAYEGLVRDASGNLYGTTVFGGRGGGTVFRVTPTGTETVLHRFSGYPTDGRQPFTDLVLDAAGNLYGTTNRGGASRNGAVFKVAPDGTETALYIDRRRQPIRWPRSRCRRQSLRHNDPGRYQGKPLRALNGLRHSIQGESSRTGDHSLLI